MKNWFFLEISANIVSSQSGTNTIQNVSQQQANQNVSNATSGNCLINSSLGNSSKFPYFFFSISGPSQTFVATLATVLPPRHQTATLVYSNPQQLGTTVTGPRLAVASPIATQRQVRPIQINSNRLPTASLSRVSNVSIRGPVLTPSNVLTTLPSGTSTTVTASNHLTVANLPAARIIQVQPQNPSGVLSTGRITGNLMTLHPLVVNASVSSANTVRSATTAKPSLTITHVGKVITIIITTTTQNQCEIRYFHFVECFPGRFTEWRSIGNYEFTTRCNNYCIGAIIYISSTTSIATVSTFTKFIGANWHRNGK